jgi:hypothetical protein
MSFVWLIGGPRQHKAVGKARAGRSLRILRRDRRCYEIGLSARNAAALHKLLAPYTEYAARPGRRRATGRTVASRQRSDLWARERARAW